MTQNLVDLDFNAEVLAAVDAALAALETGLAGLLALTPDQRQGLTKMGDKSEAFCRKADAVFGENLAILPANFDLTGYRRDLRGGGRRRHRRRGGGGGGEAERKPRGGGDGRERKKTAGRKEGSGAAGGQGGGGESRRKGSKRQGRSRGGEGRRGQRGGGGGGGQGTRRKDGPARCGRVGAWIMKGVRETFSRYDSADYLKTEADIAV
ncbi:hypothetical protein [Rhodanobacter lindaniclasticus]